MIFLQAAAEVEKRREAAAEQAAAQQATLCELREEGLAAAQRAREGDHAHGQRAEREAARPAAQSASRSLRRALLTP